MLTSNKFMKIASIVMLWEQLEAEAQSPESDGGVVVTTQEKIEAALAVLVAGFESLYLPSVPQEDVQTALGVLAAKQEKLVEARAKVNQVFDTADSTLGQVSGVLAA